MLIRPADIPEYEMLLSSDSIIAPVRADGEARSTECGHISAPYTRAWNELSRNLKLYNHREGPY